MIVRKLIVVMILCAFLMGCRTPGNETAETSDATVETQEAFAETGLNGTTQTETAIGAEGTEPPEETILSTEETSSPTEMATTPAEENTWPAVSGGEDELPEDRD